MFQSYLIVSLFLTLLLTTSGCAKKATPEVEALPAPAVTETASEPPTVAVIASEPAPPTVETLLNLGDMKLETVLFEYDSYALTESTKQLLKSNSERLMEDSEVNIIIEGHCDERGSDEYNLALGERRALATKNYLTSLGVISKRITIISYGEEHPVSAGHDETAWKQNRRAEFR